MGVQLRIKGLACSYLCKRSAEIPLTYGSAGTSAADAEIAKNIPSGYPVPGQVGRHCHGGGKLARSGNKQTHTSVFGFV